MDYYLFAARSVTHAQRMARLLSDAGISAKIRRAGAAITERGCGYTLEIWKNISVPFLCQQEVTNIAVFDSISAHIQFVHRYNVFREIVTNTGKRPKLTLDGFLRGK